MKLSSTFLLVLIFTLVSSGLFAQNQAPKVQNVTASANWLSKTLTITFDALDMENDPLTVVVELSNDNGLTYQASSQVTYTGDIGAGVMPGIGKLVTADLSALTLTAGAAYRARVIADDGQIFDLQDLVNQVDSNRLRSDLTFVQGIRHRTAGAAHLAAVKDSIGHLFQEAGMHKGEQTWAYGNYTAKNVIGTSRGTAESNKVVIVDAHYDSVSNAPGADDNGSGVVGMMEIARLLAPYPSNKTLRYIGFDLEEAGLVGSARYVTNGIPAGETIDGVLNFEMIGYYSDLPNTQTLPAGFNLLFPNEYNEVVNNQFKGNFITNVGNTASASLVNLFNSSAATYVPDLKIVDLQVPGNGQLVPDLTRSDHAPFWNYGAKALMLTDGANFRNSSYHESHDTLGKLNFTFMSNVVKTTLATAFQLAEVQHAGWGTASFQNPVSVKEIVHCAPQVRIADQSLLFNFEHCTWEKATFSIFDASGRLVWEYSAQQMSPGQYRFNLPKLATGVYVLHLNTSEGDWNHKFSTGF
jgi:Zn-dependent M28 family amino/carboxypeptidase